MQTREEEERFDARRMRALNRLSRALAHDVNGPLNAITLHLDLLRRSLADPAARPDLGERRSRYAETMRSEMQGLERALRRVLAAIRPPAAEAASFDLTRVIRELAELVEPHVRAQRSTLTFDLPETELRVEVRLDRLRQALLEILLDMVDPGPTAVRVIAEASGRRAVVRMISEGGNGTRDAGAAAWETVRELGGEVVAVDEAGIRGAELRLPLAGPGGA
jgi:signal transduction histidine kinase